MKAKVPVNIFEEVHRVSRIKKVEEKKREEERMIIKKGKEEFRSTRRLS